MISSYAILAHRPGRHTHWQDLVLFGLCALVAFPDVVLNWIGQRCDIQIRWWALIPYECAAIAVVAVGRYYLSASLPELTPTRTVAACAILICLRCLHYGLTQLFSFDT